MPPEALPTSALQFNGAPPDKALRTIADLAAAGLLDGNLRAESLAAVADRYAVALTPHVAALAASEPTDGPLRRQYLPSAAELDIRPGEMADPIGDHAHEPVRGLIHRHADRVLLKVVAVCPVYCRFCFRREMVGPGGEAGLSSSEIEAALAYVRDRPDIREVILTGGDPFMLSPRRAEALTRAIEAIGHVTVIRWHTRMPVADPQRVTDAFVGAIRGRTAAVFVAVHANHASEFTPEARAACARLVDAGIPLLSQSVLLKGVNDTVEALCNLMRSFVESRIRPYYLHHLDAAPGTAHFRVPLETGRALSRALRDQVSGLYQPTYVVDIPGGVSKALAAESDVELAADGASVRGRDGVWRPYPEG